MDAHSFLLKSQTNPAKVTIQKETKEKPDASCLATLPPSGYHYHYGRKKKQ
jgi:hypothetical protein